jgi:hypothetical protein
MLCTVMVLPCIQAVSMPPDNGSPPPIDKVRHYISSATRYDTLVKSCQVLCCCHGTCLLASLLATQTVSCKENQASIPTGFP